MRRLLILTSGAMMLIGCAAFQGTPATHLSRRDSLIIGTWAYDSGDEQGITTRQSDCTFIEKRITNYPTPNTRIVSSGTWAIKGTKYCVRYLHVTGSPFLQRLVGKEVCADILELTDAQFRLQFGDAAPITERRETSHATQPKA
jgi:hypothetical protein